MSRWSDLVEELNGMRGDPKLSACVLVCAAMLANAMDAQEGLARSMDGQTANAGSIALFVEGIANAYLDLAEKVGHTSVHGKR